MKKTIIIRCKNNKKTEEVTIGTTLSEIFAQLELKMDYGPIVAKVNNKIEQLTYPLFEDAELEFLDMHAEASWRTYTRSLFFVLCKAVHDVFPDGSVVIDIPVSNGYYCNLKIGRTVTTADADAIRQRMNEIIHQSIPIVRHRVPTDEAIEMFERYGANSKVELMRTLGKLYTTYHEIDGYMDYYYGALVENTRQLYLFDVVKYYEGLLLRLPDRNNLSQLGALVQQDKMFEVFVEQHQWQDIIGLSTLGRFNQAVRMGMSTQIIQVAEALQEKKIAQIADKIANRKGTKMVLIAGPSSSGKTTVCKRLAIQLVTNGIIPVQISLDDYFVDREHTPKDEQGEFDYESLYALDLKLFNEQLQALFRGESVELPRYDFPTGQRVKSNKILQLKENQILLVEGIHALNPELTAQIPDSLKFKVYASALTTLLLDTHNYIPTTDNRLLRRIIRDAKYRGISAQETIRRWPSVRKGETKWIFPFQENADAMFNTAMIYELAVIKLQAEPLLSEVPENSPEYAEACRLLKFLQYIKPLQYDILPSTSLLREFLGGSSFNY